MAGDYCPNTRKLLASVPRVTHPRCRWRSWRWGIFGRSTVSPDTVCTAISVTRFKMFRHDTLGMAHGRFGVKLLRPKQGQVSFGPLDDVDVGTDTHLPLQSGEPFLCVVP